MVRNALTRPVLGAATALLLGAAATVGLGAAPASAQDARQTAAAPDFAGIVALNNCSGSLVALPDSQPGDPALVLTNGHCLESGMPSPGEVVVDKPSSRSFTLLDADAGDLGTLKATKISYATMTDTDMAIYETDTTYEAVSAEYGIEPLEIAAERGTEGAPIDVVSGYWKKVYSCNLDAFVHELHEDGWVTKDSLRYTSDCQTVGGTSGSPVIDRDSGKVVGVNNTGNESGGECTLNNPCEVDENGEVTVREGINYGQQVHHLTKCVTTGNKVDLSLPECALPKP
ncbi:serine protease [Streptomyces sp. XM4193]|uniref:trypsin-like serine peptidase n=1 Tax=Streptomyces sp. XM4193 TaxID=2929782 RepID=UPI001FFAC0AE|nr:serine protease [Streptomyces sp. XM4193]MCK1795724.1 serine protease [Streptomyces sp. XM4193]